ncbi:unnamed protein product [Gongylonema pulchrum]|uniref:DUF1943 domain-containing protein n=1 Tax=Gongylonema pulchrum TaxID=637853 RepID=A0A183DRW4_9BILA|nr:unnamed protein product [Gongylonema pulchrum]
MLVFELSRVFPTLSGLPLQFMLNASLAFKMDGKMRLNFVELLRQRGDADAQVKFRPSVSASLGARVLLRAGHVASGALASSNLYGATDFLRQMELRQGSRLSVKAEVPHHDIFIAKFRNDAVKVEMNRHQPLVSIRRIRQAVDQRYCSGENLAKILGLRACYNVIFIFFTAGMKYKVKMTKPIRADFPVLEGTIRLEKADPALNSYQLLVERASDRGEQKLKVSVDTPGSQVNRKMEVNFELSVPRKKLKMGITTPFKTISLDGDLQEAEKVGERNSYKLNAKSAVGSGAAAELAAEAQYSIRKPYAMLDFQLEKVFSKPIVFKKNAKGLNALYSMNNLLLKACTNRVLMKYELQLKGNGITGQCTGCRVKMRFLYSFPQFLSLPVSVFSASVSS